MLFQLLIYMSTDGFKILEKRKHLFCLVIIIALWFENHLSLLIRCSKIPFEGGCISLIKTINLTFEMQ